MTVLTEARQSTALLSPQSLPLWVGAAVYGLLLLVGPELLNDPDTYSHIALGRWIIAQRAVPFADPFTHTAAGAPWVAFEWLSQLAYALAHAAGGWPAVVMLGAGAVALSLALLTRWLLCELAPILTLILVTAAFVLMSPHILARPHVLAFPVMVIWVGALVRAVDTGDRPPFRWLPLMTLWANLHGSFTLGLAIVAPIAIEAVWYAADRKRTAGQWALFGVMALAAGCITPYGPELIEVTHRTIALGPVLEVVGEWKPQNFSHLGAFEVILLAGFGYALYRRIALPPWRILMLLGLVHLALAQSRHADVLALLAPLFLARPLAREFGPGPGAAPELALDRARSVVAAAGLVAVASALAALRPVAPDARITPAAAIAAADLRNVGPILNDYDFGGYLDYAGLAPFIDGRAELYGAAFTIRHHRAVTLQNVPDFLQLLKDYRIEATLLTPATPAAGLLDQLPEWQRVYADGVAVVHVRRSSSRASALSAP